MQIAANTEDILRQGGTGSADLVVASRVHMAGGDLTAGIAAAPDLLREEGLLIARGPQSYKRGVGYSQIARQIHDDEDLGVIVDHRYTAPMPGGLEACRLIVAQEI